MQRLCSPSISRSDIGAVPDQQLGDRATKRGGGDVKRGVATIHIVADVDEEEVGRTLPRRTDFCRRRRKIRGARQDAGNVIGGTAGDKSREIKECKAARAGVTHVAPPYQLLARGT